MTDVRPRRLARRRRGRPRGVLAALLALALAGAGAGRARAEEETPDCEALLRAGRAREAVACFRARAEAPGGDTPDALSGLGRALLAAGDPQGALEPLRRASEARGTPADRLTLAAALVATAEARMAAGPSLSIDVVPYLRDALLAAAPREGATPEEASAGAFLRAKAHHLVGEPDLARKEIQGNPALRGRPDALDLLGRIEHGAGDYAASAEAFQAAGNAHAAATAWYAAKDPRVVPAYLALLRDAPTDEDLLEEAIGGARAAGVPGDLERALAAAETPPQARGAWLFARARLAEMDGRAADALALHREAAAADPEDPRPLVQAARLRWSSAPDDPAAVEEALRTGLAALALSPQGEEVRWLLDSIAAREAGGVAARWPDRSRVDRAIAAYRALAEADRTDSLAWANLGNALRIVGDVAGSLSAYDAAVEANPHDASIWNDRGLALSAAGRDDDALASFRKAISLDAGILSPRQNAARIHWRRGELDEAQRHLEAALRSARAVGAPSTVYRFLLDRVERSRARADAR
jgi:tetratricopeptide (TPR) repeat protein